MYVLAAKSRHKRPMVVKRLIYDVNNPSVQVTGSAGPITALLFELEFGRHHERTMLDRARRDVELWKGGKNTTGGCIRSATLHARYLSEWDEWWFEAQLAVAARSEPHGELEHVVGVHFDPLRGPYVTVFRLDGNCSALFHLDEAKVAGLLGNDAVQGNVRIAQRTE